MSIGLDIEIQEASMGTWLLDETAQLDESASRSISASLGRMQDVPRGGAGPSFSLALRMNDAVIYDVKKWFGGANVRMDAIVVNGAAAVDGDFYQPATFRFPDVKDGERLPIVEPGLTFFYGKPRHFLDVSILVSRDRKDTKDLAQLIVERTGAPEWKSAFGVLLGLAVAAPQAAAVTAAVGAAITVGNFALNVLQEVTGTTIGLYRASFLQERDRFGIGRHPSAGAYRMKDFEFWYEIVPDKRQPNH
jgi:hypothetical protein